ncbi:hypothetical protein [Paenibacillus hubeiensis]|uniref:hypothetical protein n=1 Tax=Paenibacillus hubeiensis TaxID=3077330 RepID=UPI0031BAA071
MSKKWFNSRVFYTSLWALFIMMMCAFPAFADDPKIVSGSKKLGEDGLKWVLVLIPVGAAAFMGYHALAKLAAENDSAEIASRNKSMKRILIAAIIGESVSGIVTLVLGYYK